MKRQIFGRKEGASDEFKLLSESDGASAAGSKADPEKLRKFEVDNTRRAVTALREKKIEGYVLFEGDPTHYVFTSTNDFTYPAERT